MFKVIKKTPIGYIGGRLCIGAGKPIFISRKHVGEPLLLFPYMGVIKEENGELRLEPSRDWTHSTVIVECPSDVLFTSDTDFDKVDYVKVQDDEENKLFIVATARVSSGAVLSLAHDNNEFMFVWA